MPFDFSRREFLAGMGAATAAAGIGAFALPAFASSKNLKLSFSTLGCPAWNWIKILDFAKQYRFTGVELRGLMGNMDLPTCPEFGPERIEQSKKDIASRGLHIASVDSSAYLHDPDPAKHEEQMSDSRRFIDLASKLGAPYIRVMGNQVVGTAEETIARVARSLHQLGEYAGPKNVMVLLESHGDFVRSRELLEILQQADSPHVALVWDAHNTFVGGPEQPEVTVSRLGKYIRHTHLKDSIKKNGEDHYVLTGRGEIPVKKQVQLLVDIGYEGYFSYEWEKVWHPDIDEPEIAFPEYAKVIRGYLKDAYAHQHK